MSERKRKLEVYEGQPGANGVASAVPSFGNGTVNLYTGKPYSQRYYDILSKRKGEARTPAPSQPSPPPTVPCTRVQSTSALELSRQRCSLRHNTQA